MTKHKETYFLVSFVSLNLCISTPQWYHSFTDRIEWHGDRPYEDVSDGQRRYEVVGRLTDLTVDCKTGQGSVNGWRVRVIPDYDQQVPEGGDDDADGHGDSYEDCQEHSKRSWPAGGSTVLGVHYDETMRQRDKETKRQRDKETKRLWDRILCSAFSDCENYEIYQPHSHKVLVHRLEVFQQMFVRVKQAPKVGTQMQ